MKKLILTLIVLAFFANVQAQLEVDSVGHTYAFGNIYLESTTNFLGTTGNNVPVAFKVDNVLAGFTGGSANGNVAFGYNSLNNPLSSSWNVAVGIKALYANTTGSGNIATGGEALFSNTLGENNIAIGNRALYSNTGGCFNIAIGDMAMGSNTTSGFNIALGAEALCSNTTGNDNTAIGGFCVLYGNTTGCCNTAIGSSANFNAVNLNNTTAIGYCALATASDQVSLGNSRVTSFLVATNQTAFSDGRTKKNIRTEVPGLSFINRLQPVMYNFDLNAMDELQKSDDPKINAFRDSIRNARSPEQKEIEAQAQANKEKIVYSGFIAQDVESAARSIGYDFSGVDAPENGKGVYGLRYAEFVVPLVKAVQELSEQNNRLQEQNNRQQEQINELTELVYRLTGKEDAPPILKSGTGDASGIGLPESPTGGASLEQNVPNPFSVNTEIRFFLPDNINQAYICIFDMQGTMLKKTNNLVGQSTLVIQGSELKAGMYLYSLIVDGKEVDTKRMILTQ